MTREERLRKWSSQAGVLAVMGDDELRRLVEPSQADGWGVSSTATLPHGSRVFVKRIPLTEVEYARAHSTRNHFNLPLVYQYGVGSAGLGAWRELATHVKTTGWVVDGSWSGFPLLLHHRVIRRPPQRGVRSSVAEWVDTPDYVAYWNGSKRIASFIAARRTTPFELWLVLEHVPHRMFDWLGDHQFAVDDVVDAQLATVRFLQGEGVFHFDAHFGNVVTDGVTALLTDFGLANDRAFDLSARERAFLDRHQYYDFGETIYSIGNALLGLFATMPKPRRRETLAALGLDAGVGHEALLEALVSNVDVLDVSPAYAAAIEHYEPVIGFMGAFFGAMRNSRRKDAFFDDVALGRLLADAGVDDV